MSAPFVTPWSFDRDLADIVAANAEVWAQIKACSIFMTGGTGLIGRWMLESLCRADEALNLGVNVTVLTRDADGFTKRAPHLAAWRGLRLTRGDVVDFESPSGRFDYVIHGATDASAHLNEHDPRQMFDTVVGGTRRTLDLAVEKQPKRFLYLSSGAVYGNQPWEMERAPETFRGGPDCTEPRAAYAEGKRAAEMLCGIYGKQFGLDIATARIFALLGPHLNLDAHFAAGNFIRDAMAGRPAVVKSSGQACRSYLYLADVTTWLWQIMARAPKGAAYNVGSEEWVSMHDLAERTARLLAKGEFEVQGQPDVGWNPGRYVPATAKARDELGLQMTTSLDEAIRRTALWNGWRQ